MTPYYRRRTPEWWEELAAAAAGAAAGLATYWVARTLLGREPLPRPRRTEREDEGGATPTAAGPRDAGLESSR